ALPIFSLQRDVEREIGSFHERAQIDPHNAVSATNDCASYWHAALVILAGPSSRFGERLEQGRISRKDHRAGARDVSQDVYLIAAVALDRDRHRCVEIVLA